ncbi:MAG TPA: arsenate reductase family protein [Candidatus Kapabacteria bacterium]|nr:arsenate reductase family protein [Candidatus Kapabacteria bacterium]
MITDPEGSGVVPTLTIYQKPTCSTCREVMMRLRDAGVEFDAINYVTDPPSRRKLGELVRKMGIAPRDLLRTKEPEYLQLGLDDPAVDGGTILDAMAEHPILIQRPIIEYGRRALLARPAERVSEALQAWGLAG